MPGMPGRRFKRRRVAGGHWLPAGGGSGGGGGGSSTVSMFVTRAARGAVRTRPERTPPVLRTQPRLG